MAKRDIVERDGKKFVRIPLTKPYLIEKKIYGKGTNILVEEEGVIDTIATDTVISDPSYDEIYDKASMRRMKRLRRMDDLDVDDPSLYEDDLEMEADEDLDDLQALRRARRLRRLHRMEKDEEDLKEEEDKKDDEDEEKKMRRIRRMRRMRRMRRAEKDEEDLKEEEDKEDKEDKKEDKE